MSRLRIYERLVSEAGLYCYAFLRYTPDKAQRRTLNALWELAGAMSS